MSYGLFDCDIHTYINVPFNLELMKIATYYKKKREIVSLSPYFLPQRYQHFIYRKDYVDSVSYPIMQYSNIEYGGRAFNSKYKPMAPEIEKCKPDTSIYSKYYEKFSKTKALAMAFRTMSDAEHLRLSLDGKTIWPNFETQLKHEYKAAGIFLHDYDLGKVGGARDVIRDLIQWYSPVKTGRRIGMKFPVQISTSDDLINWTEFKPMGLYHSVQYNGLADSRALRQFFALIDGTSLGHQFTYNPTEGIDPIEFQDTGIVQLYRQIVYLRSKKQKILLKYAGDFFTDINWQFVMDLIIRFFEEPFTRRRKYDVNKDTMFNFVSHLPDELDGKHSLCKNDARHIFNFVRENNYQLFKDFYEYTIS